MAMNVSTRSKIMSFFFLGGFLLLMGCSEQQMKLKEPDDTSKTPSAEEVFSKLEEKYDARLGIYALDTGTGDSVAYRSDERFTYASTHKALSVGVLLQQKSLDELDELIMYTEEDLVNYNPVTENHVESGMTLKELSDASIRYSDNTAANLIFDTIGGPEGFKEGLELIGDDVTEPVRIEPDLNYVEPGETQDTSTAEALAKSLQAFTLEGTLPAENQELLIDWLKRNTTGDALIRAGVPEGWEVGDKTGSGNYGTRNDIGIIWPPDREPIVLAVLSSRDDRDAEHDDQLIAEATEEIIAILIEEN
ncbi:class A beta-lactamase [Bacillus sp. A116_S68]|nr:class A beta-lactamase [Bacillus sp. A116_S68]